MTIDNYLTSVVRTSRYGASFEEKDNNSYAALDPDAVKLEEQAVFASTSQLEDAVREMQCFRWRGDVKVI